MIIERTVPLNPVEPAPLSFRAPMGMECKLDIGFLTSDGQHPIGVDLAAQLQLTSRSGNRTSFFSLAATDIVNGKTRAIIPADYLVDVHGYRLLVTGTVKGEPQLLAQGTVMPIAGAGPEAVPPDIIDGVDLNLNRDAEALVGIKVWSDDAGDMPYDLTAEGAIVSASIYDSQGGNVLVPFSVTVQAANQVLLSLTVNQVNALPDECWWSLVASTVAGVTTLAQGKVTVSGVVKPPFDPVVLVYDYEKPDALTPPTGGQIIHANYALDVLRIDDNGNAATLDQLIIGDTIQINVTTWTILAISKPGTYYQVTVSPTTQAGVSGTQNVTFARP